MYVSGGGGWMSCFLHLVEHIRFISGKLDSMGG